MAPKPALLASGKYGSLTVDFSNWQGRSDRKKFLVVCDCGYEQYLSRYQLRLKIIANDGCERLYCAVSREPPTQFTVRDKLRVQLKQLVMDAPHEVVPEWGGCAFEGVPTDGPYGIRRAITALAGRHGAKRFDLAIRRKNSLLPYSAGNSYFTNADVVRYGDAEIPVTEAASMYNTTVTRIRQLIKEHGSEAELIEVLIEESLNGRNTA